MRQLSRVLGLVLLLVCCHVAPFHVATGIRFSAPKCKVGLNYGMWLSSAPVSPTTAFRIMVGMGASSIKLFNAEKDVYKLVNGTNNELVTGIWPFDMTSNFTQNQSQANEWVFNNIVKWPNIKFTKISVANELIDPGVPKATMMNVVPGMWALYRALQKYKLQDKIKIVTPQHLGFISGAAPASKAYCVDEVKDAFVALLDFLQKTGSSLWLTNFPFYPLYYAPEWVNENFTFFRGYSGYYDQYKGKKLYYQNMFDQQIDSVIIAADKLGYRDIPVEIAETGWPSGGSPLGSVAAEQEFVQNVLGKVCSTQGTPLRPGKTIPTHVFEAFDEDLKFSAWAPWESTWGLNYMNGTEKFPIDLSRVYPAPPGAWPPPTWCIVRKGAKAETVKAEGQKICSSINCAEILKCCVGTDLAYSVIYDTWFQSHMQNPSACNFSGTASTTTVNPSTKDKKCSKKFSCGRPYGF